MDNVLVAVVLVVAVVAAAVVGRNAPWPVTLVGGPALSALVCRSIYLSVYYNH
jgi:hypothetical protein